MEDILFEVLVWEQIEGCSGKFMSAPVDAAIARDTLVTVYLQVINGHRPFITFRPRLLDLIDGTTFFFKRNV
jgi:hypothetical protein